MSLYGQIIDLEHSLESFKADQPVDWQIGKMANAMISQAKAQANGNPVVEAIDPFEPGPSDRYISNATAGTVRAVLKQLAGAVPADLPFA